MPSSPVNAALVALVRHLEEQRAQGGEYVWLSPKARKELRELSSTLSVSAAAAPAAVAKASPAVPEADPAALPSRVPAPSAVERQVDSGPAVPSPAPARLVPPGATKEEKLRWLAEQAENCPAVRELDSLRDILVFSVGNPDARLMLIGEAPGAEEERQREPFVGPAGQLLTKMIVAMGLERKDTYISNIVKFRPAVPNQGESNRKPSVQEMAACLGFIQSEIEVVQPEVIVALGGTAAQGLLGREDPVGRLRNQFHSFQGIPLMVTFHPSYLLRNAALSERRKVWEDLLMVMERLKLPISPKQRAYFTA